AAGEGNHRSKTCLSHRHGRACRRPELEAATQQADPGEPGRDQQDPDRLWRASARRERSAARCGGGQEGAMRWRLAAALAAAMLAVPAWAQQDSVRQDSARQQEPFEPEGYRADNYRAPVPATLEGARVL